MIVDTEFNSNREGMDFVLQKLKGTIMKWFTSFFIPFLLLDFLDMHKIHFNLMMNERIELGVFTEASLTKIFVQ